MSTVNAGDKFGTLTIVKDAKTARNAGDKNPMRHRITFDFEGCEVKRILDYAVADMVVKVQAGIRRKPEQFAGMKELSFRVEDMLRGTTGAALVVTPQVAVSAIEAALEKGELTQEQIDRLRERLGLE